MPAPVAFINMPYARPYESLYLAYIAGLSSYGLVPTAGVDDPSSESQLDRVLELMFASAYSFHELSWIGVDRAAPHTPRFNMPFELGLAVAYSRLRGKNHQWFVFDTVPRRLDKALSDLTGVRARVHNRTPRSLLVALMNALTRERHRPTITDLVGVYDDVATRARELRDELGSSDLFDNRPFAELVIAASTSAHQRIKSLRGRRGT
jgi:hypothetical protein